MTVETVTFNKTNKLRASDCTPESQRIEIEVTRIVDPVSGTETLQVPDGYNYDEYDPCTVVTGGIGINANEIDGVTKTLNISFTPGTYAFKTYEILVDGSKVESGDVTSAILTNGITYTLTGKEKSVQVIVVDESGEKVEKSFTKFSWSNAG